MNSDYLQKIKILKKEINSSIMESEELSSSVYESLPKFEAETEKVIEFTTEFLSQLKGEGAGEDSSFLSRLSSLRNNVSSSLLNIASLVDAVDYVFREIFKGKGERSFVEQVIQQAKSVEHSLEDLNSVALNASITSSQLGSQGGAFSVLSSEIERQSNKLVKHFDTIARIINRSFPDIASFRKTLESFGEFTKMKKEFHKIIDRFSSVEDSLENLQQSIKKGTEQASQAFPDILANMVGQDIFRQQMEHIMEFLDDVESRITNDKKSTKKLSFLKFVLEVTQDILSDSTADFSHAFQKVEDALRDFITGLNDQIATPSMSFSVYFSQEDPDSLYRIINEVMVITVKNTVFMEEVLEGLGSVRDSFIHFRENVVELDEEVSIAMRLVKRFKTMNILIKAELARLEGQMGKKAQDIRDEFDEAIEKVTKATLELSDVSKSIYKMYLNNAVHFDSFKDSYGELVNRKELKDLFKSMESTIAETESEYRKMMNKYEKSMGYINSIYERFKAGLNSLEEKNAGIHSQIVSFEGEVPAYDDEFLQDEDLRNLSEKFTTYRERLKASEHMDIEDVGTEGGEFTLF